MREALNKTAIAATLLAALAVTPTLAAALDVRVVDPDGEPVPGVAVFVQGGDAVVTAATGRQVALMDQVDKQFVPHVLVVQEGTAVQFPNSDTTAHHVYSFSRPNDFVLPLYKGDPHEPIVFDADGVVVLGCNIHDDMLGYIVVVDSDAYGITDADGRVRLAIADRTVNFSVQIWSPRIRDQQGLLTREVSPASMPTQDLTFALQKKLRAPHNEQSSAVAWSEY